jgi:hypothetical protein
MVYGYKNKGVFNYNYVMKILQNMSSIENHPYKDIIYKRVEIIEFFDKYGLAPTVDAYEVSRATIFNYKRKLELSKGKLASLAPKSTKPINYKQSTILQDKFYLDNVLQIRSEHPKIGKDKIKVLLDKICVNCNKSIISISTVGRIISLLKTTNQIPKQEELMYRADTGKLYVKKKKPKKDKKRRNGYYPYLSGHLMQIDCVIKIINGIRRYIVSAIDYRSAFSFSYAFKNLSSKKTKQFFLMLEMIAPFQIEAIQTDNGSEFLKEFQLYLKTHNKKHFFTHVRHPQENGKIERYNRTIQEEFADYNLDLLAYDIDKFNEEMMEYLIYYNLVRPHYALGQIPPLEYIVNERKKEGKKESKMLWTHT